MLLITLEECAGIYAVKELGAAVSKVGRLSYYFPHSGRAEHKHLRAHHGIELVLRGFVPAYAIKCPRNFWSKTRPNVSLT